jgi:hypothetical protein
VEQPARGGVVINALISTEISVVLAPVVGFGIYQAERRLWLRCGAAWASSFLADPAPSARKVDASPSRPLFPPGCFQAPKAASEHANNIFKSNAKRALISPRFSNYESLRNTNISHIIDLANELSSEGFSVGMIPDQDTNGELGNILESTTNIKILREASFSIPLRLALAELVNINLFTPCALQAFGQLAKSKPNIACFDMYKPPNKSYTGDICDYQNRGGMTPWETYPYPWSAKNSIFVWEKEFNCQDILQKAIYASSFPRELK